MAQNEAVLRAADEDAAVALSNLRPVVNFIAQGSWTKFNNELGDFQQNYPTPYYENTEGTGQLTASILS